MATKANTSVQQPPTVALAQALGAHVETVRDLDGMPTKVLRVGLVQSGDQFVAVAVGRYGLSKADGAALTALVNEAHTLVDLG